MIIKYGKNTKKFGVWRKNKLGIKFRSPPVYDKKYLKTKVREYYGAIKTNFLGNGVPKENMNYTSIASIIIDSVMGMDKKIFPQVYLKNVNIKNYKCKDLSTLN